MLSHLNHYKILLATQSPRRHYLLQELGLNFEIVTRPGIDEQWPQGHPARDVAAYLAQKKAQAYQDMLQPGHLLITADTVVLLGNKILNKPQGPEGARAMLQKLSGQVHEVITGVCVQSVSHTEVFSATTQVHFAPLAKAEISYYVDNFAPFDKAGAYGIQEWIGYIGIDRIEGSYFNVMGLPVKKLYDVLKNKF